MFNWEYGPEPTNFDRWEEQLEGEYAEYLEENCKCHEECECMSFKQFKNKRIDEIADLCESLFDEEEYAC